MTARLSLAELVDEAIYSEVQGNLTLASEKYILIINECNKRIQILRKARINGPDDAVHVGTPNSGDNE